MQTEIVSELYLQSTSGESGLQDTQCIGMLVNGNIQCQHKMFEKMYSIIEVRIIFFTDRIKKLFSG